MRRSWLEELLRGWQATGTGDQRRGERTQSQECLLFWTKKRGLFAMLDQFASLAPAVRQSKSHKAAERIFKYSTQLNAETLFNGAKTGETQVLSPGADRVRSRHTTGESNQKIRSGRVQAGELPLWRITIWQ